MKLLKYVRRYVNRLTIDFIWAVLHLRGSGLTETEVTFRNIEQEVNGELREKQDYQHLPPWQWTSVADLQEMGVLEGGEL